MAAVAARFALRSSRTAATRVASGAKSRSAFRFTTENPLSRRIFRSPIEMSSVCVESLLPYHTATATALLNSMLSAAPRSYGWILEDCQDDV